MKWVAFILTILLATPVFAQVPSVPVPSDMEILNARVQADEAQLALAQKVVARMQADAKTLADWWASYVAGLAGDK